MRVLGIDPGMARLGWSVLENSAGRPEVAQFGCLETPSQHTLTQRLVSLHDELEALIVKWKPTHLALETLFFVKNAKTLAQVGHVRGVILLLAGQHHLEVSEYAPRQIKMALTGFGGADKKQMQLMVQRLLKLASIPTPDDAADAVAVALTHMQFSPKLSRSAVTV
jgi:crossover junction endodeoxyribonuclease RuvC